MGFRNVGGQHDQYAFEIRYDKASAQELCNSGGGGSVLFIHNKK